MVLIREAGKWKVYHRPYLGSIIHYIVKDHEPVSSWVSTVGKIKSVDVKRDRLTFIVSIDEIDFKKYKKRTDKGIIVEILDGQDRTVCEAIVEKPGENVTFGWEYV